MAALIPVTTPRLRIQFLKEVIEQQKIILGWYQSAFEELEDIKIKAMIHGMLTHEEIEYRHTMENMKLYCIRLQATLNDLIYFTMKGLY